MDNTNYTRSVVKEFSELLKANRIPPKVISDAQTIVEWAKKAVKFMLPLNGTTFYDTYLKALDSEMELRLPFDTVALEFQADTDPNATKRTKVVILAKEVEAEGLYSKGIALYTLFREPSDYGWAGFPYSVLPSSGYLKDNNTLVTLLIAPGTDKELVDVLEVSAQTVLQFLNVLSCANTRIDNIGKTPAKARPGALPFDDYHVITIPALRNGSESKGGTHRSPREHVRRGHIRRYQNGTKIWINSMVVSRGVEGKIDRDYRVE